GRSQRDRLDLRRDRVRQPCDKGRSPCPGRTRTTYRHFHDRAQGGDRPLPSAGARGFEVTWLKPGPGGRITPQPLAEALREDNILVAVMHLNHENGVIKDNA